MRIRAALAAIALLLLLTSCGSTSTAAAPPSTATSPVATITTTSTATTTLDAGEQFLKLLGSAAPTSRSGAVEMGRVMAKEVCPKIKYGDQLIVASLTAPLLKAGYGNQETKWVWDNPQLVTTALSMSFCDPRYN